MITRSRERLLSSARFLTATSFGGRSRLSSFLEDSWSAFPAWLATVAGSVQYVLIIHEVADYPAWKKVFDGAATIRKEAGERSYQVLKFHEDPNRIVHFSAWTSVDDAKRFFESPKLVKIRAEAGVRAPTFIYLDQLEGGIL